MTRIKSGVLLALFLTQLSSCIGVGVPVTIKDTYCTDYSTSLPWNQAWTSTASCRGTAVSISSGTFNYNGANGGVENRLLTPITVLSNTSWSADFDFTLDLAGHSNTIPGHILAAFTAGPLDPYYTVTVPCDGSFQGTSTSQDAIVVEYYSTNKTTDVPTWKLFAHAKDGTTWLPASTGINIATEGNHYIRVQRVTATQGVISVFTNPGRTIHLAGSPQCFPISSGTQDLRYLQHGVMPQGGTVRTMWGKIDNLCATSYLIFQSISGPHSLYCSICTPPWTSTQYTYTVASIPGATYTASSWTLPPGVTMVSHSPDYRSVTLRFDCSLHLQQNPLPQITVTPNFGNGVSCGSSSFSITVNDCRP